MKFKYKSFILIWCVLFSCIVGMVTTKLIIEFSDQKYFELTLIYILYFLILLLGIKLIVRQSKKDLLV